MSASNIVVLFPPAGARGFRALTRARLQSWCTVLLAVETALFLFMVAGTHGWIVPLPHPVTTDFVSFHAAGDLAWHGLAARAYDIGAHYAAEQAATESGIEYQFFFYPPVFLLVLAPLSRLPYLAAFIVFQSTTLTFYLLALRHLIAGRDRSWVVPALAFPAVFWTLGFGQNAFLTAALLIFGLSLLDRRPLIAGLILGCLCYKPHIGMLLPVALIAGRHWRAFASTALSVTTLVILSVIAFGTDAWLGFLHAASTTPDVFGSGRIDFAGVVTPFAAFRLLGLDPHAASPWQWIIACGCAVTVACVWRRDGSIARRAACLISATLLAIPVLLLYDLMLLQAALAWLLLAHPREPLGKPRQVAAATAYLMPMVCRPLARVASIQAGPLASIALLAWALCAPSESEAP